MTTTSRPIHLALAALIAVGSLALAACSGSSSSTSNVKANGVVVKDAWARTSAMSSGAGAVYVTIENTTDRPEKLLSAAVPSSVARSAQIHETVMATDASSTTMAMGGSTGSTMAGSGMMSMVEVPSVLVPAGGTVKFESGGYHIMLIDLAAPLKAGQKFTMTLGFMNAGPVQIDVVVKDS